MPLDYLGRAGGHDRRSGETTGHPAGEQRTPRRPLAMQARLLLLLAAASVFGIVMPQSAGAQTTVSPDDGFCLAEQYDMTGADQAWIVPAATTSVEIKAWGAGAPGNNNPYDRPGFVTGSGGYAEGTFAVGAGQLIAPGDTLSVMVGESRKVAGNNRNYGFGAAGVSAASGGGLSGVFAGGAAIAESDMARAIVVAGGGGGNDDNVPEGGNWNQTGGPGGDAMAGGNVGSMAGTLGSSTGGGTHSGGGGGGYEGGALHKNESPASTSTNGGLGGTSFVAAAASASYFESVAYGAPGAPNVADPHYVAPAAENSSVNAAFGMHGLVVIQYCVAVDSDGDGIVDGDELPGQANDACLDPNQAGWVALPTNDCDGDGTTVADGDQDDNNPCADTTGVVTPCPDTDGDGALNDVDTDLNNPCESPADPGWVGLPSNDCDGDNSTVGDGDSHDVDPCTPGDPNWVELPSNDCDNDSTTVGGGDSDDTDSCVDATVGPGVNDCDGDGTTVAQGDSNDFDSCVDLTIVLSSNDCDGDGTTVADGDSDDTDSCVDLTTAPPTNDCDGDGVTVADGDTDDRDGSVGGNGVACVGSTEPLCYRVTGRVWLDENQDGVRDAGEPEVPDVTVELYRGGIVVDSTVTATGPFVFDDLPPATYEVRVDSSTVPDSLTVMFDVDGGLDHTAIVTVVDGDVLNVDFGYAPASIRKQLLHNGEPVANQTITIVDSDGNTHTVTTDENGWYELKGSLNSPLATGPATVTYEVDGELFTQTIDILPPVAPGQVGVSDGSLNSDDPQPSIRKQLLHNGEPVANQTITIVDSNGNTHTVTTDENGWYELTGSPNSPLASGPATVTYEVDGELFTQTIEILPPGQDGAGNGSLNGDDPQPSIRKQLLHNGEPVANQTITIVDSDGNTHTVTTDENGWYELTGSPNSPLASGPATVTYEVDGELFTQTIEILPPGQDGAGNGSPDVNTVGTGGGVPCVSSSEPLCYEMTGRVWFDENQDGVRDAGETDISGVTVELYQDGVLVESTVTASPYVFDDLPPGSYDIHVDVSTLPAWLLATYGIDPSVDSIVTVTIVDGDITNIDFSYPSNLFPEAPDQLAFTGANSTTLALLGMVLVLAGLGLTTLAGRCDEATPVLVRA